ncbi:MAG: hypothetical protein IT435_16065 [Phycisphaerales bacterium]|nr:hypothetical protein [Phycisphaerales bacterium]
MALSAFQLQVRADAVGILAVHGVNGTYTPRAGGTGGPVRLRFTGGEHGAQSPGRAQGQPSPSLRRSFQLMALAPDAGEAVANGVTASGAIGDLQDGDSIMVDAREAGVGTSGTATLKVGKGVRLDEGVVWLAEVYP